MIARFPLRLFLIALLLTTAWSGWLGVRHLRGLAGILDRGEFALMDFRITATPPPEPTGTVVIVAIDDETVAQAKGFPIERDLLAALVTRISQAEAQVLAIDLLFLDPTTPQADHALIDALALTPTVLAAAATFATPLSSGGAVPQPSALLVPRAEFTQAARVGLVNVALDAGGTPRHVPMIYQTESGIAASFAVQAATLFSHDTLSLGSQGLRIGDRLQPLDLGWHLPLRYYGGRGTIPTISAQRLLEDASAQTALAGKIVVIGATATGVGDRFNTPFDPILPGVEVLATGLANLVDGQALVRDSTTRQIDVAVALGLAVVSLCALAFLSPFIGSAVVVALLVCWIAVNTYLFGQGYWFSASLPLATALPAVLCMVLARQVYDRRQARIQAVARHELSRFHAPLLAAAIAADPNFLREPCRQEAAIVFVDLSGFTGLSERLGPYETRTVLKAFHSLVVDVASQNSGTVLDFMGDGAMIGFGIPQPTGIEAQNALQTGFDLIQAVTEWTLRDPLAAEIKGIRIGVHAGPIVVSRLGHESQQQIAATGDSVNVASRLMEVGKTYHATLVASGSLLAQAQTAGALFPVPDLVEDVEIRGRKQPLNVALWRVEPGKRRDGTPKPALD